MVNELENLREMLPEIAAAMAGLGRSAEVLMMDDGSSDGTAQWAAQISFPNLKLIHIQRRAAPSLAGSWREGMRAARGALILIMDADGSSSPEYFVDFWRAIDEGADLVLGSRYLGQPGYTQAPRELQPFLQRFFSRYGRGTFGLLSGLPYSDLTHSFRMFRREIVPAVLDRPLAEGNVFLVWFLFWSHRLGFKIKELPVTVRGRRAGTSKLRLGRELARFIKAMPALLAARCDGDFTER